MSTAKTKFSTEIPVSQDSQIPDVPVPEVFSSNLWKWFCEYILDGVNTQEQIESAKTLIANNKKHSGLSRNECLRCFNKFEDEIFDVIQNFYLKIYGSANVLMAIATYDCQPPKNFDCIDYKAVLLATKIMAYRYLEIHNPDFPQPQVFNQMKSNHY
ncbi:MAG TPA: hypothetical protein VK203_27745 [Nostocaceae cyanobacterium]|nr:hypothetical protein [Nostocaceae cyanobacterium]